MKTVSFLIFLFPFATNLCFIGYYFTKAVKNMPQRNLRKNDVIEKIFNRNYKTVYRIAYLRTANTHDAEDIMQEVFLRFVKNNPEFENLEHEKAWFIKTTINRTNSFFTSAWKRRTVSLEDDIPFSEQTYDNGILEAVLSLPKDISTAIHLHYYEDMPVKDISKVMDKSESAVKSLLFRGRKMLKLSLTDTDD